LNIWGEAKNLLFSRKLFKKFNFWKERNFDTLEFCFLRKTFKENYPNFCICKTTNIAGFELGPRKDRLLGRAGMRRVGPGRHETGWAGSAWAGAGWFPPGGFLPSSWLQCGILYPQFCGLPSLSPLLFNVLCFASLYSPFCHRCCGCFDFSVYRTAVYKTVKSD